MRICDKVSESFLPPAFVEHNVYWAPNVWPCSTPAHSQQQLSKHAVWVHKEGLLSVHSHWCTQDWKAPFSRSEGIWGANAILTRRICVTLTADSSFSKLCPLLLFLSPSLLSAHVLCVERQEPTIHRPLWYDQLCLWQTRLARSVGLCWVPSLFVL